MPLQIRFVLGLLELAAVVVFAVLAVNIALALAHRTPWEEKLEKRRLSLLLIVALVAGAVSIGEDALDGGSGPIDQGILLFLYENIPASWASVFETITFTGSWKVILPLTAIATAGLYTLRRRYEAMLIAASGLSGALMVYLIKTLTARERPALWETETYWGTSFPSGHTLAVSALAFAAVVCIGRIRPAAQPLALWIALLWVALVALSRLVLGVHWPTDVLVAACLGACVPLVISVVHELRHRPGLGV
jgi:undecaprenyl-diphosphatase